MTAAAAHTNSQRAEKPVHRGLVRATDAGLFVGAAFIRLDGVTSYRIQEKNEEGTRLGNVIMLNLFIGAALGFLIGVLSEYLPHKFYLAVGLFSLLSLAALDDVVRSRDIVLFRLFVQRQGAESMVFVTSDVRSMRAVAGELDKRLLPRTE